MAQAHRFLIVDDDPAIHELIQAMVAGSPWSGDSVSNGEEALARCAVQTYDALLVDILMPGMDGLSLLAQLRAKYPGIPVVMMTLRNTPDHILESLRREAAAYLSKPFSRENLLNTLQNARACSVSADDIKILSDKPNWISVEIRCRLATAERLAQFVRELPSELEPDQREQIATAFRELLMNAVEHGGHLDPEKKVELSYVRTARSIVYYIRDPGEGFSMNGLAHAAIANSPDDPIGHLELRRELGIRPGGFGLLMTQSFADELIYSAKGNEVILIKYLS
jgi:CheY-like chemotaxis protein/anti-sigma regulatory factor (Ser/Thr protein kinase)